ncbi:MAG: 50S ribosomal protein L25/general stress protein Ctc [Salinivirgaceae bacterium]|nr:50S ribosomal protein L25/general stress protein Ctc [Salinivirgaceae bacterium]
MKTVEVKASVRKELGKKATRALRAEGKVPCSLYGGESAQSIAVPVESFRALIYTPDICTVNLDVDGKVCKAILKDVQYHPVTDEIEHVDFLEVSDSKPVVMSVPVVLNGLADGVKKGGKLVLKLRKIKTKGLINAIPDTLDIDVTSLDLGKSVKIQDLNYEGLELMEAKNVVVCTVKLTRNAISAAQAANK